MPIAHGQKMYSQLLIDPHRYRLLEHLAQEKGQRVTAVMREILYEAMDQYIEPDLVRAAESLDAEVWRTSIRNRVQGRRKKRPAAE